MPTVPTEWELLKAKTEKGEPEFVDIDNPGHWPEFTYRSKFEKTGEKNYTHHALPTGNDLSQQTSIKDSLSSLREESESLIDGNFIMINGFPRLLLQMRRAEVV